MDDGSPHASTASTVSPLGTSARTARAKSGYSAAHVVQATAQKCRRMEWPRNCARLTGWPCASASVKFGAHCPLETPVLAPRAAHEAWTVVGAERVNRRVAPSRTTTASPTAPDTSGRLGRVPTRGTGLCAPVRCCRVAFWCRAMACSLPLCGHAPSHYTLDC